MSRVRYECSPEAIRVVTPPSERVISLAEAYQQLRLDPDFGTSPPSRSDDTHILQCIDAATGELDGPDAWLGRALAPQTLALSLDRFPERRLVLPFAPLIEVSSITYLDSDGNEQTLTPGTDYRIGTEEPDAPYVEPVYQGYWPRGRVQGGAVVVTYVAGYGDGGSPPMPAVPALIKQYLLARLSFYYEHREPVVIGTIASVVPTYIHSLENLRIRGTYRG